MYNLDAAIPQIKNLEAAVDLYYSRLSLSTKDICILFGCSASKAQELMFIAANAMKAAGEIRTSPRLVTTETAYMSWGLDIEKMKEKLEQRCKMRQLYAANETEMIDNDSYIRYA